MLKSIKKTGHYSVEKLEAYTFAGKQKTCYDFEFGKGWKKRPTESSGNK